jgi:hypothetical protein
LANDLSGLITQQNPFNFEQHQIVDTTKCAEVFRWIEWDELHADSMSLPIDKVVIDLLKRNS